MSWRTPRRGFLSGALALFGRLMWPGAVRAQSKPPVNTSPPTISGVAQQGQTLAGSTGVWTNSPTSYTYQWKRGGTIIAGATAATYLLVSADVGSTITVTVTARNRSGSGTATSAATAVVTAVSSGYPASYFTGPLGARNILPPSKADGTASGPLLIMWSGVAGTTDAQQRTFVQQRMTDCGRTFDCVGLQKTDISGHDGTVASDWPTWIHGLGSVPLATWSPAGTLPTIASGAANAEIDSVGDFLASLPFRVMIRLFHEFDDPNPAYTIVGHTTTDFTNAWKLVVNRILAKTTAGGRTNNVGFFMCPTDSGRDFLSTAYPGDTFVDWMGCDAYNSAPTNSPAGFETWQEFDEIMAYDLSPYNIAHSSCYTYAVVQGKPFVVGETGCKYDRNGDATYLPSGHTLDVNRKANWFRNIGSVAIPKMGHLCGIEFFDQDVSSLEATNDWRVDSNCTSLTADGTPDSTTYQGFKDLAALAALNVGVVGGAT